jgi:hypothetical protein
MRVLSRLAIDAQADAMLTRITEFVGRYDPRANRTRGVERLALEQGGGTGNFGAGTGNFIGQIRNDRRMRFSVHTGPD